MSYGTTVATMLNKREQRKLDAKKKEWDEELAPVDRFFDRLRIIMKRITKETKYNVKSWLDSYFHDTDLKSGDKFIHRFWVVMINLFILWILTRT